jgi:hypothetical protein
LVSLEKQKAVLLNNVHEKLFAASIDLEQESINAEYFGIIKIHMTKRFHRV